MFIINPYIYGKNWQLQTGNLVYMTSNNAPSPYVATVDVTPTSGSPFNVFDNSNTTSVQWNNNSGAVSAKMVWTVPIRIVEMIVKTNRSGQPTTSTRIYGIKADASEVLIYNNAITSNTDVTVTSTDQTTEFVGVRVEIDRRSDLIVNIYNLRITQWYSMV